MAFSFHKLLLAALLLSILFHEPTFRLFVNLLVNVHIFLRITFDIVCTLVDAHFPAVASIAATKFHELRAFASQRCEWAISGISSWGHTGLVQLMKWTTFWLEASPLWLCELNELLVDTGKGAMGRLQGDDGGKTMEGWLLAAETVETFCEGVRSSNA